MTFEQAKKENDLHYSPAIDVDIKITETLARVDLVAAGWSSFVDDDLPGEPIHRTIWIYSLHIANMSEAIR